MKKRILGAGLSLKVSLLPLGFFLVLAIAFHPTVAAAASMTASCNTMQDECFSTCNSNYDKNDYQNMGHYKNFGCVMGCAAYRELCVKHLGEIIMTSAKEEMLLVEATLPFLGRAVGEEGL